MPDMRRCVLESLVSYLPETILTNEALAQQDGCSWTSDDILSKTGIRERRVAAPDECASDLAVKAVEKLEARKKIDLQEVDYLLFCTQSPDYFLPTTACLLQERLGLSRAIGALDFNLGCSGYVAGLSLAKGLVVSGQADCVLLVTAETYSKHVNRKDMSVATLFGDAATATILRGREDGAAGLDEFVFGTDGRGGKQLIVPSGAMRLPRTEETAIEAVDGDDNARSQDNLYMNGREIFRFVIQNVPKTINALLSKAGLEKEELDFLVLHQASQFTHKELVRKLKLPPEKAPMHLEAVGNTVSSTIPIVLEQLIERGELQPGHRVMLVGFGVGYSWAGNLMTWQ
jgi:3-oxoacyl-[acyl-carrier-protein] synthase III